jgi:hypothetical protein
MTIEGYLPHGRKIDVMNTFSGHLQNQEHLNGQDYVMERIGYTKRRVLTEVIKEQIHPLEREYAATDQCMKKALNLAIKGMPFSLWPEVWKLDRSFGNVMGSLYGTPRGLKLFIKSVSEDDHAELLRQLREGNPFSVLFDSYMDKSGRNYFSVMFYMEYHSVPQTKIYRTMLMDTDGTGEGYYEKFRDFAIEDNIWDTVKNNLVSIAADGASTNQGGVKSFHQRIERAVSRKIHFQWCLAHRMDLVYKNTLKRPEFQWMNDVVEVIKLVRSLYGPKTKRRQKLVRRMIDDGKNPIRADRLNPIRWSPSVRKGLSKIWYAYEYLIDQSVEEIGTRGLAQKIKEKLEKLVKLMLNPNFVTGLGFWKDNLEYAAEGSLITQIKDLLLIDSTGVRHAYLGNARGLSRRNGVFMQLVLESSTCGNPEESTPCTVPLWESGIPIMFRNKIALSTGETPEYQKLSFYRPLLEKAVDDLLEKYIPIDEVKRWGVFGPLMFEEPDDLNEQYERFLAGENLNEQNYNYGRKEFEEVAKIIGYNELWAKLITRSFTRLIHRIVLRPCFQAQKNMKPSQFWEQMLTDNTLPWTSSLKEVINKILKIPAGSVELERLFSIITHFLGNRRLNLSPAILDHLLRLKWNLPKDLSQWIAYEYIHRFVVDKKHCRVDDALCGAKDEYAKNEQKRYDDDILEEIVVDAEGYEPNDPNNLIPNVEDDDVIQDGIVFGDLDDDLNEIDELMDVF